ncbi:hypothetical protein EVAR_51556_1 [Eumeta japonica]|uniref:Uncharacterized protein n=1 Tax=Eumeta variegata TaxID=151549 RepID=A0A4C1YDB2_EUMVA|nr:hypothetical protein EVAR_51556_1 [Eumeta japonica]
MVNPCPNSIPITVGASRWAGGRRLIGRSVETDEVIDRVKEAEKVCKVRINGDLCIICAPFPILTEQREFAASSQNLGLRHVFQLKNTGCVTPSCRPNTDQVLAITGANAARASKTEGLKSAFKARKFRLVFLGRRKRKFIKALSADVG